MTSYYDPAYTRPAPGPAPPAAPPSAGFAVTSLVLGIIAFIPPAGVICGPLAVVFGALRLRRGSAGRGMAVAGFTLGIIAVLLYTAWVIVLAAGS
jgi:hypothetical protein